jgi:hypothetical protein
MKVKIKGKKTSLHKEIDKIDDKDLSRYIKQYIKENSVEDYLVELTKIILRRN